MARIAKKYIDAWAAEWKEKQIAGTLPPGYRSSKPMTRREYIQRRINTIEYAGKDEQRMIKNLEKQLVRSKSRSEKKALKEEIETAKFYKEAIKEAARRRDPERIKRYEKEAESEIQLAFRGQEKKSKKTKTYNKNDDIYFRYLGISKHDKVTLKDGSTYTLEDLKKAIDKANISIKKSFFSGDDITKTKYSDKIYTPFISKVETKLKNDWGAISKLSDRDKEGMQILMGLKGGNATLKYK